MTACRAGRRAQACRTAFCARRTSRPRGHQGRTPGARRVSERLRVYVCTSEAVPFAKTGGLADVCGALPRALAEMGCDVRLVLPGYGTIDRGKFGFRSIGRAEVPLGADRVVAQFYESRLPDSPVPTYLVANDHYFGRQGLYGEGGRDYPDNLERFTVFGRG